MTRFRLRSLSAPPCARRRATASTTRWRLLKSLARRRRTAAAIVSKSYQVHESASTAASTTSPSSAGCAPRSRRATSRSSASRSRRSWRPEQVRRYEMLLRLIDEKGRLVLPGQFMSSATRYQLLPQIDRCVISDVLTRAGSGEPRARVRADACFDQPVRPDPQRPDVPRLGGRCRSTAAACRATG